MELFLLSFGAISSDSTRTAPTVVLFRVCKQVQTTLRNVRMMRFSCQNNIFKKKVTLNV